ncbi:MAG: hypothetical protein ACK2UO_16390, partial [Caldilineaceae bacterium]
KLPLNPRPIAHDPPFLFHRWNANLDIIGVDEIKTVPFTPVVSKYGIAVIQPSLSALAIWRILVAGHHDRRMNETARGS